MYWTTHTPSPRVLYVGVAPAPTPVGRGGGEVGHTTEVCHVHLPCTHVSLAPPTTIGTPGNSSSDVSILLSTNIRLWW